VGKVQGWPSLDSDAPFWRGRRFGSGVVTRCVLCAVSTGVGIHQETDGSAKSLMCRLRNVPVEGKDESSRRPANVSDRGAQTLP
jgi:hypothetical protein